MTEYIPLTVILPAEPAVFSCLPPVVEVSFSQSPVQASPVEWSRPAANTQTNKHEQMNKKYTSSIWSCSCVNCQMKKKNIVSAAYLKARLDGDKKHFVLLHCFILQNTTRDYRLTHHQESNQHCCEKASTKLNIDSQ